MHCTIICQKLLEIIWCTHFLNMLYIQFVALFTVCPNVARPLRHFVAVQAFHQRFENCQHVSFKASKMLLMSHTKCFFPLKYRNYTKECSSSLNLEHHVYQYMCIYVFFCVTKSCTPCVLHVRYQLLNLMQSTYLQIIDHVYTAIIF